MSQVPVILLAAALKRALILKKVTLSHIEKSRATRNPSSRLGQLETSPSQRGI